MGASVASLFVSYHLYIEGITASVYWERFTVMQVVEVNYYK